MNVRNTMKFVLVLIYCMNSDKEIKVWEYY